MINNSLIIVYEWVSYMNWDKVVMWSQYEVKFMGMFIMFSNTSEYLLWT